MITFGQGLYNLTDRDRSTLYVDSFFRSVGISIAALSDTATATIAIPLDRCLYLNNFSINLSAAALSTWTGIRLDAVSDAGVNYRIVTIGSAAILGDNASTSGANVQVFLNRNPQLLLPPNTRSLSFSGFRSGNTNAVTGDISLNAYLLPPGGIGRLA